MPGTGQWTDPTGHVWASGEVLTAANLVAYVEKNLAFLGAGYGAVLYRGATQSINDSTDTVVQFDTVENDPQSMATTGATARITIPTGAGGVYLVQGGLGFASASSGSFQAKVMKNGAVVRTGPKMQLSAAVNAAVGVATQLKLVATDYIQIAANQTSGGAVNVVAGQTFSWFAVHLLGPF